MFLSNHATFIPEALRSQMGESRCWIAGTKEVELIYIYIPIASLLVLNTIFYSITAYKILRVQKETSMVRKGDSGRHSNNDLDKARSQKKKFDSNSFYNSQAFMQIFSISTTFCHNGRHLDRRNHFMGCDRSKQRTFNSPPHHGHS